MAQLKATHEDRRISIYEQHSSPPQTGSDFDPFICREQEFLDERKRLEAIGKVATKQALEYYKRAREHVALLP